MSDATAILIPSMDNRQYLQPCLESLTRVNTGTPFAVYVINNGAPESCEWIDYPAVTVLQAHGNRGWEGALQLGLDHTREPLVLFANDDIFIPLASSHWLLKLANHFVLPQVAAVGPSSNCVAGMQSIWRTELPRLVLPPFLIGFCLLVQRSALIEVGGIDLNLPGGDDVDLSIRLKAAGYGLLADRSVFVYHHGFRTGERVHGTADKPGGWNSAQQTQATYAALVRKHGAAIVDQTWGIR